MVFRQDDALRASYGFMAPPLGRVVRFLRTPAAGGIVGVLGQTNLKALGWARCLRHGAYARRVVPRGVLLGALRPPTETASSGGVDSPSRIAVNSFRSELGSAASVSPATALWGVRLEFRPARREDR